MTKNSLFHFVIRAITFFAIFFTYRATAGYIELSGSGNYRKTYINFDTYSTTQSASGGVAYYFAEMSAIQLSYTQGYSFSKGRLPNGYNYYLSVQFDLIGLDLVIAFTGREASFQPYIKFGGAIQTKKYTFKQDYQESYTGESKGLTPTAGTGVNIRLTKSLGLKLGLEAWSSPVGETPTTYDYAARAGLSWIF